MKGLVATAITLMMTAAIGTAAASPYDHRDRQEAGHAWHGGAGDRVGRNDDQGRWNGSPHDRYNRDRSYYGGNGHRGYWHGGRWYQGWRYAPRGVSVVIGGAPAPYYYGGPAYYAPAPAYGYDGGYGYQGDDGYADCAPGTAYRVPVRRDNTGAKLLGALVGGALGNTVGKGDGRTAATVAGAAIGYGVASSATRDRGYAIACGG